MVGRINFPELDAQFLDYVQVIPPLAQRSSLEKLIAAFQHFFPEVSGHLPRAKRFVRQLQRQYKSINKPPMIWDVVVLIIIKLIDIGFPTTALAAFLQFDCFLRPNELCNIVTEHVAFPGGNLLGSQAQKVLILLPITKTGPLQSVRVESKLIQQLLARLITQADKATKLFPSYFVYRKRLTQVLEMLGLTHIGYTPHSIRHGAATMALINEGEKALPGIMYRGRWESIAGKSYLQMGAAALLFAELPDYLITRAKKLEKELPKAFASAKLIPTV